MTESTLEVLPDRCPNCGEHLETFSELESDNGAVLYSETSCICGYKVDPTASKISMSEVLQKIQEAMIEYDQYKKGIFKGNSLFSLGYIIESVQLDMIKSLYLKDAQYEVPETYLFSVRSEHPHLLTSDFIQHIWDLQNTGASIEKGEAKLITYTARRKIKGIWREVLCGKTSFHWSYFFNIVSREDDYDGVECKVSLGEKYNVYTKELEADLFADASCFRKNISRPITYRAYLSEFMRTSKEGMFADRWKNAEMMLGNIAKINAIKLAFPNLKNLNIDYESMLQQGEQE